MIKKALAWWRRSVRVERLHVRCNLTHAFGKDRPCQCDDFMIVIDAGDGSPAQSCSVRRNDLWRGEVYRPEPEQGPYRTRLH